MRISQNMIYSGSIRYMNETLYKLAQANEQNATQKRINRPSDDPSGYAEARALDASIDALSQYSDNVDVAKTWLNQADSTLVSASTLLTSIRGLAEQAATGTLSAENRQEIALEARQYFQELLSLSNTSVTGGYLFAGQKTSGPAFTEALYASVSGDTLSQSDVLRVSGNSDSSVLVQFTSSGQVGGSDDIGYRYSSDGGTTWTDKTLAAGQNTLDLDGVTVQLANGTDLVETGDGDGSSLVVRPSALYLGDDQDGQTVRAYGSRQVTATAQGAFSLNVTVRLDSNASLPGPYSYSYSTDGGVNWTTGNTASGASLPVPGGLLILASGAGNTLAAGDQFTIVPNTADISVNISPNGSIVINNVGKDVFGGLYQSVGASNATAVFGGSAQNIFETVGDLIGCLETNDIDGVGDALASLTTAQEYLESCAADVGARETRLGFTENTLSVLSDNATARLTDVEDADLSQLLLDLTKYQYAYQSVLSSSSKIMGMSLLDYI